MSVLLAVAVHDGATRLESAGIDEVRVAPGQPQTFRVSYRVADDPRARDAAALAVSFRLDDGAWVHEETAVRDRPVLRDDAEGSLEFTTPPMSPGRHVLEYRVRFVGEQHRPGHAATQTSGHVGGQVAVVVE